MAELCAFKCKAFDFSRMTDFRIHGHPLTKCNTFTTV